MRSVEAQSIREGDVVSVTSGKVAIAMTVEEAHLNESTKLVELSGSTVLHAPRYSRIVKVREE